MFWDDIEEAIKTRAAKVLYILSRTSNAKDGPLKELHFAQIVAKKEKLKDFVVPLHIDDLPHGDITIEITRINTVAPRVPGARDSQRRRGHPTDQRHDVNQPEDDNCD